MLRLIVMVIATSLTLLFLVMLILGRKYDFAVEKLVGNEYTLSEVYGVGFMWGDLVPAVGYRENLGRSIAKNVNLLVKSDLTEFYTRAILAKACTFMHLGTCVSLLLGLALFDDATTYVIAAVGVLASFVLCRQVLDSPAEEVQRISDELVIELPDMVTKMALLLDTGMTLREAWIYVADHTSGIISQYMKDSCEMMKNGKSDLEAFSSFGNATTSREVKKVSSMVIQGTKKGNEELSELFTQLSSELWDTRRQKMLQMGETASTKLMIPTMLMFAGLLIVIVVSSMNGMSI